MMNGYLARLTRLLLADSRVDQITPGYYCTLPRNMAKRRNNMALSRNSSMDGSMDEVTLYSHIWQIFLQRQSVPQMLLVQTLLPDGRHKVHTGPSSEERLIGHFPSRYQTSSEWGIEAVCFRSVSSVRPPPSPSLSASPAEVSPCASTPPPAPSRPLSCPHWPPRPSLPTLPLMRWFLSFSPVPCCCKYHPLLLLTLGRFYQNMRFFPVNKFFFTI